MHIYNLHSQIEKSNEIINVLTKFKDEYEKNNQGVEIIKDGWKDYRTIQLQVPNGFLHPETNSHFDSATIYQISVTDAILVLQNHVVRLQKALEEEQYLKTGTKVYVSGRAGASAYTNKNGELVASIKVFVEKLELISQKMPSNQQTAIQPTNYPMQQGYDQPQAQYTLPQGNIDSGFNPPF